MGRLCEEHDAYRWLRGGVPINYHVLADFRVQHGKAQNDLLTKMLAAMMAEEMEHPDRQTSRREQAVRERASAGGDPFDASQSSGS